MTGDLGDNTRLCWAAIQNLNEPPCLFSFGSRTVWIGADGSRTDLTPATLGRFATDHIRFFHVTPDGEEKSKTPSERLFRNMLAGTTVPLPELGGITTVPVFSAGGELQMTPGYSPDTKMFYAPPEGFELPDDPDPDQLDLAKEILLGDILGDFPFDGDASQTNAVGAIVLPLVRPMIIGPTPLHLISKPKAGTGASLLADVLAYTGLGKPRVATFPEQEDERRRMFFSLLRSEPGAIVLDNVSELSGQSLASVLTETTMTDRIVGESTVACVPNRALWIATGNNPELSDEIARRTVPIHLDAKKEQPEMRTGFRHPDLREWMTQHRTYLIWAALTLVQNWVVAGRPVGSAPVLGGFENWSRVIGGILDAAGIGDFLGNLEHLRSRTDLESLAIRGFVGAWAEKWGTSEVKTGDLLPLANGLDLGRGNEQSRSIRLGQLLHTRSDQVLGDWVIKRRERILNGHKMYRLEPVQ